MIRVLVAERIDVFRLGICSVLDRQSRPMMIDTVSDRHELLLRLGAQNYELVILEPALCREPDSTLIKEVCQLALGANVLVFTAKNKMASAKLAIRSGAKGYLTKNCSPDEFLTAVERVARGKTYLGRGLIEDYASNLSKLVTQHDGILSNRELETFSMLVLGNTVSQIAAALRLSVKTVSTHKSRLMQKLQASSTTELVHYAISKGLMDECKARSASASSRHLAENV